MDVMSYLYHLHRSRAILSNVNLSKLFETFYALENKLSKDDVIRHDCINFMQ